MLEKDIAVDNLDSLPPLTIVEERVPDLISTFYHIIIDSDEWRPNPAGACRLDLTLFSFDDALAAATEYLSDFRMAGYRHPAHKGHIVTDMPDPLPPRTRTGLSPRAYSKTITLSQLAWTYLQQQTVYYWYDARGQATLNTASARAGGINAYLRALLKANPADTPAACARNWADTRPDWLQESDHERLAHKPQPKPPLWALYDSPEEHRTPRVLNRAVWEQLQPQLAALARHFIILPLRRQADESALAGAALEAIGMQYLTPLHEPQRNPSPPGKYLGRPQRRKARNNFELVF